MGSKFLPPCLLLAMVVVSLQHRVETTTEQTPSNYGGLFNLVVQQSVELSSLRAEMSSLKTKFSALKKTVKSIQTEGQGSTFVRWGRKSCSNGTTLIYRGFGAGKKHDHSGGGTNYLCLPENPQFDNTVFQFGGTIYGTEYELPGPHYDHDMPCSVCRAPKSTTVMIPATLTCPQGWTAQYNGHLVGQHTNHKATEYICLDSNPEHIIGGHVSRTESFVYYEKFSCGNLPCPPYINGKVATCVVCSK